MRPPTLRLGFLFLLLVGAAPALRPTKTPGLVRPTGGFLALTGGRVIDGTGSAARENCTVLLEDGVITAVGSDLELPEGTEVLDVSGKTVVPGLIDVHGHLYANVGGRPSNQLRTFSRLYLAGGVTTIFSPGDLDPQKTFDFRDAQRVGEETGARIFTAGPYFNHGAGPVGGKGLQDAEDAREQFAIWEDRIDGVKVYTDITPEEFSAVVEEAHEVGLRVTGHLGSLTAKQAVELGIDRLEHGIYAMSDFARPDSSNPFDMDYMVQLAEIDFESGSGAELIQLIVKSGVVVDPTVVIIESLFAGPLELTEDWERYLAPSAAPRVEAMNRTFATLRAETSEDPAEWTAVVAAVLEKQRELVRRVHEAGGTVVCGTDPVFVDVLPGYGMHREAEHFVQAGLTELETLRACTLDAARALGIDEEYGSIEPGKVADLLVLDGDPSADITHLGATHLVIQEGATYAPAELRESVLGSIR